MEFEALIEGVPPVPLQPFLRLGLELALEQPEGKGLDWTCRSDTTGALVERMCFYLPAYFTRVIRGVRLDEGHDGNCPRARIAAA